ncbi:MAG: DNA-protecting protein DprA, partial [Lachnospiraceae bacterium]|nr:DNA-protecting protein DprA [Lachnospiraceae bacterium]
YTLASELKLVYACLDFVPKSVTQVARELGGYNLEKLDELLFDLEIEDRIEQVTTGYYVRKK